MLESAFENSAIESVSFPDQFSCPIFEEIGMPRENHGFEVGCESVNVSKFEKIERTGWELSQPALNFPLLLTLKFGVERKDSLSADFRSRLARIHQIGFIYLCIDN